MKNEIKPSCLVVVVALLMAFPLGARAQDYGRTRIDTTVRLDRGGAVDLSLISGKIRVTGWDRPDVRISASIDRGMLRFDANSSRVTLSVDQSDDNRGHGRHNVGDARYEVSVPRGSRLVLEAVSGDVAATGSQGEIEATSVSGDVDVSGGVREVSVEAVSGSVHAGQVNGNLRAESVSGDVRVETVTGNVEATSVSGSIRLVGVQSKDVRTETVSGDVTYSGSIDPGGKYSFETHSGTVRLNIPRGAGAHFSVETFSGDISSDFPVTVPPYSGRGRKEGRVDFTIGDGRARVDAQTFSGSIVISSGSTTRRDDE
ncbi:MAG: DUF4097 domain-containing protein [Gemmatimonadota bacterium]|nr:DUF4097 domain-containing protein [Gemmatimonadota bacterium]